MRRACALVVAVGMMAVACSSGEIAAPTSTSGGGKATSMTSTTGRDEPTTTSLPGGLSPVEVSLVSGESASGTELRIRPSEGQVENATLTVTQQVRQTGLGETSITFAIDIEVTTEEVTADGEILSTWRYTSLELIEATGYPPGTEVAIEDALGSIAEMSVTQRTDARGRPLEVHVNLPDSLDPSVAQAIEQTNDQLQGLEPPLPAEPVEEGAVWEVRYPTATMGIEILSVYMYELVELHGDSYLFNIEYTQSIDGPQIAEFPGTSSTELTEFSAEGSGTVRGEMTRLLPVESTLSIEMDQSLSVSGEPLTQSIVMDMQMVSA